MAQVPLAALRTFEAVARHGSFSRAADALCVTQSAVSHQIRGLEAWFGAPLFERQGNRASLLPHGAALAAALERAFGDIEAACRQARRASAPPILTVAAIPSVAICWLIPRLGAFRALAPETEIRLVYAIHGHPIEARDVDLAVVFAETPPSLPEMATTWFLSGVTAPVCGAAVAARLGPAASGRAMAEIGLLHDTDGTGWRQWLEAAGEPGVASDRGPVFEDFSLLRAAALAGQGVALCPLPVIADDLGAGRLVQLSPVTIREASAYYVLTRRTAEARAATACARFHDWLIATAREAPIGGKLPIP
ncbi:MAG: LysR family transcriptional regulator [Amaricoccus sp.]